MPVAASRTVLRSIGGVFYEHRNAVLDANLPDYFTQSRRYSMDFTIGFNGIVNICEPIQVFNGETAIVFPGNIDNLVRNLVDTCLGVVVLVVTEFLNSAVRLEFRSPKLKYSLAWRDIPAQIEGTQHSFLSGTIYDNGSEIRRANINRNDVLEFTRLIDHDGLGEYDTHNEGLVALDQQYRFCIPAIDTEFQKAFICPVLLDGYCESSLCHNRNGEYGIAVACLTEPHSTIIVTDWNIDGAYVFSTSEHFTPSAFKELGRQSGIFPHTFVGLVM
jgi:hypothetical protein